MEVFSRFDYTYVVKDVETKVIHNLKPVNMKITIFEI